MSQEHNGTALESSAVLPGNAIAPNERNGWIALVFGKARVRQHSRSTKTGKEVTVREHRRKDIRRKQAELLKLGEKLGVNHPDVEALRADYHRLLKEQEEDRPMSQEGMIWRKELDSQRKDTGFEGTDECPSCGAMEAEELGSLGSKYWVRCRNCGSNYVHTPIDQDEDDEDMAKGGLFGRIKLLFKSRVKQHTRGTKTGKLAIVHQYQREGEPGLPELGWTKVPSVRSGGKPYFFTAIATLAGHRRKFRVMWDREANQWAADFDDRETMSIPETIGHFDSPQKAKKSAQEYYHACLRDEMAKENKGSSASDRIMEAVVHIQNLRPFIGQSQIEVLGNMARKSEEKEFFHDKVREYAKRIEDMPKSYATDGQGDNAVAYLHYFKGGMDWYITEKDVDADGEGQIQAFGLANLGYGAELGYINIKELIDNGVELDLHWEPKTLAQVKNHKASQAADGEAGKLTEFLKQYHENEEDNAHTANMVLLAETFGNQAQLDLAHHGQAYLEQHGNMDYALNTKMYEQIHVPLWKKFVQQAKKHGVSLSGDGKDDSYTLPTSAVKAAETVGGRLTWRIAHEGRLYGIERDAEDRYFVSGVNVVPPLEVKTEKPFRLLTPDQEHAAIAALLDQAKQEEKAQAGTSVAKGGLFGRIRLFFKSKVKQHPRKTKTGKVSTVREYSDKRTKKQKPAGGYEGSWQDSAKQKKAASAAITDVSNIQRHRNGEHGEPFDVVQFSYQEPDSEEARNMVGIVFPGKGHIAVFDRDLLGDGRTGFGENSWRGDQFETELRTAIGQHTEVSRSKDKPKEEEFEDDGQSEKSGSKAANEKGGDGGLYAISARLDDALRRLPELPGTISQLDMEQLHNALTEGKGKFDTRMNKEGKHQKEQDDTQATIASNIKDAKSPDRGERKQPSGKAEKQQDSSQSKGSSKKENEPLDRLKHHVSGAIERGEKEAIVEKTSSKKEQEMYGTKDLTEDQVQGLEKQIWLAESDQDVIDFVDGMIRGIGQHEHKVKTGQAAHGTQDVLTKDEKKDLSEAYASNDVGKVMVAVDNIAKQAKGKK